MLLADVKDFKIGDSVVSDTPRCLTKDVQWGGWQKFVLSRVALAAKVGGHAVNEPYRC